MNRRGEWVLAMAGAMLIAASCDSPTVEPASRAVASLPASAPAASRRVESPAESAPASAPASHPASEPTSQPASASAPALEPPPKFLKVIQTDRSASAGTIRAKIGPGSKLSLDTENVRRLRIDRDELELPRNRSILLQIDGQAIEWTPKSPVREFERTPAGVWQPVRPK